MTWDTDPKFAAVLTGDSAVNVKLLTQGANVQVATYLPDSDTLQIQFDLGRSDTVQCAGQCTECLYQYELQVSPEVQGTCIARTGSDSLCSDRSAVLQQLFCYCK